MKAEGKLTQKLVSSEFRLSSLKIVSKTSRHYIGKIVFFQITIFEAQAPVDFEAQPPGDVEAQASKIVRPRHQKRVKSTNFEISVFRSPILKAEI